MTTPMSSLNEKTAVELTSLLCNVVNRLDAKRPSCSPTNRNCYTKMTTEASKRSLFEASRDPSNPSGRASKWMKLYCREAVFISFPMGKRTFHRKVMTRAQKWHRWKTCQPWKIIKMTSMNHETTRKSQIEQVIFRRSALEAENASPLVPDEQHRFRPWGDEIREIEKMTSSSMSRCLHCPFWMRKRH